MTYKRQIRWFAPGGDSVPVSKREFESLDLQGRAALAEKLDRLRRAEIGLRDLRHLRDNIYEVRVRVGSNQYRATLIQDSPVHFIILSCFVKKSAKTPKQELDKAIERSKTWEQGKSS